jgi:hypothetical protein
VAILSAVKISQAVDWESIFVARRLLRLPALEA